VDVSNGGEQLVATRIAKAPTIDIAAVGAVAITPSVLRVGAANDHFNRNVDIPTQMLLMRVALQIERLTVILGPFAMNVQSITWKASG
jgi:hypothetical protein